MSQRAATPDPPPAGVILLTFGAARDLQDVPRYLASVRGGRPVPPELVAEFQRRLERVGGSPLVQITQEQARALEAALNRRPKRRGGATGARDQAQATAGRTSAQSPTAKPHSRAFRVAVGMRHSAPSIAEGLRQLQAAGARPIVGIVMSPQFSPRIMGGYLEAVVAAERELGLPEPVRVAGAWHLAPPLITGLGLTLQAALARAPASAPVIFTAHSLPRAVADHEPEYLAQLRQTAEAVAAQVGLDAERWQFAYQSAGHTREEWLRPDVVDLLPGLASRGQRAVVVASVQFVADHLEVLYDVDVAAREQAAAHGLELVRPQSLNTDPHLIDALAWVVQRELGQ